MLSTLEKHWPLISILLLIVLLASLWLWPEMQGLLTLAIIIVSVGMLLAFTIRRRVEESRQGALGYSMLWRMIALDVVGILLVLGLAMYVGRIVSEAVGIAVYGTLMTSAPQWAEAAAIVSGLLAALAAGVGVGWVVRSLWGKVEGAFVRSKAQANGV